MQRWRYYHRTLPKQAANCQPDVIFGMKLISRKLASHYGTVATINNMLPFTPEQLARVPFFSKDRLRLLLLRWLNIWSVSAADAVLLHSQHALDQVSPYVHGLGDKSFVALTGIPRHVTLDGVNAFRPNEGRPYILYFSAIYPYKNHLGLIEGYKRALHLHPELPELLIGGYPADKACLEQIKTAMADPALGGRVRYIGVLKNEETTAWLHHAVVNFFPSQCETNSVVQSEIIGSHGVMACSDIPPMNEVAHGAAELFDPYSSDSIATAICNVCCNPERQKELRQKSEQRARDLSWSLCADITWQAVERAWASRQL